MIVHPNPYDQETRGLEALLNALPEHERKNPGRRAEVARVWARVRQRRNDAALARMRQGDSLCGLPSCARVTWDEAVWADAA